MKKLSLIILSLALIASGCKKDKVKTQNAITLDITGFEFNDTPSKAGAVTFPLDSKYQLDPKSPSTTTFTYAYIPNAGEMSPVATVNATGMITILKPGTIKVVITQEATDDFNGATKEFVIEVLPDATAVTGTNNITYMVVATYLM